MLNLWKAFGFNLKHMERKPSKTFKNLLIRNLWKSFRSKPFGLCLEVEQNDHIPIKVESICSEIIWNCLFWNHLCFTSIIEVFKTLNWKHMFWNHFLSKKVMVSKPFLRKHWRSDQILENKVPIQNHLGRKVKRRQQKVSA